MPAAPAKTSAKGSQGKGKVTGVGKGGSGKGAAAGGAKRHKKAGVAESVLKITKPALRRLARRAGVKRISGLVYEDARTLLKVFVDSVVYYSMMYKDCFGRKTISLKDVVMALKRRGQMLIGAEIHHDRKRR